MQVNRGTNIIVLDDSDVRAVKLARAVTEETGLRAYVLAVRAPFLAL